jgi:flagellar assembly protein FliH
MGPQNPNRPPGGIAGLSGNASDGTPLSVYERREHEAEQLLAAARREAEKIQADAYHAGFEQGEKAGEKLTQQKLEPLLQSFNALLSSMQQQRTELIRQYENDLIKVAFAIATQVVKHEIEHVPETLQHVVQAALLKVHDTQHLTLRLAPIDAQLLQQQLERGEPAGFPHEHLTLVADDTVGRGGCRVQTDAGDIDATIETQLRLLKCSLWNEED